MIDYLSRSLMIDKVQRTFIVHGEEQAAQTYKDHLYEAGFRNISVPEKGEIVEL